ncbi:MAG: D-alanyl-D-alanine endopeptidase [Betaproteobacteria bacterium]|nr:D-alanyl-D-alanine endopeptidase [Betaproteobacteria bacterium]
MAKGVFGRLGLLIVLALALASPVQAEPTAEPSRSAKNKAVKSQSAKNKAHKARAAKSGVPKSRAARKALNAQRAMDREMGDYRVVNGLPVLRSAYAVVIDQQTGALVYAKNPDQTTPIASITKLMTAMVVLDAALPQEEAITVSEADVDHLKHTRSRLPIGATVSRSDLLHMALIASENRAAAALSRAYPGGREAFVVAMNQKAKSLGMTESVFVDGTGLSSSNRATAQDLARMVSAAYTYPAIREISTLGSYDILVPGRRNLHSLAYNNTNALTRNKGWDIGVSKTGYINEAGHCLVMQAKISDKPLIIVLLDAQGKYSRIGDANRLRRWLENGTTQRIAKHAPGRQA